MSRLALGIMIAGAVLIIVALAWLWHEARVKPWTDAQKREANTFDTDRGSPR